MFFLYMRVTTDQNIECRITPAQSLMFGFKCKKETVRMEFETLQYNVHFCI